MKTNPVLIVIMLIITMITLSACNLPSRQPLRTQTPTPLTIIPTNSTPTPIPSLCDNQFFPNITGDSWEYSGTNSAVGAYTRTDIITKSNAEAFTQESSQSNVTYSVVYSCSSTGLTAMDPIQQYVGALLSGPNAPVNVKLTSNSGISLPATINPGDTWQQITDWDASSQDLNLNVRFVFNHSAVGFENVTVPFGVFNALRVDTTIRIETSGFRILAGTYTTATWMVPKIGIIKSEGTSHITGADFTDSMELTRFTPSP
jgi:hypothetical protein